MKLLCGPNQLSALPILAALWFATVWFATPWFATPCFATLCFAMPLLASDATAQQLGNPLAEIPDRLYCYGRVIDQAGEPVRDVTLALIAPTHASHTWIGSPFYDPRATLTARSMDGEFDIEVDIADRRFHGKLNSTLSLLVEAEGHATRVLSVPFQRLFVDTPFVVELRPLKPTRLRVLGPDGNPLPGVTVAASLVSGVRLPFHLDSTVTTWPAITDREGYASLSGCDVRNLAQVTLQSDEYGIQRVPLIYRQGETGQMEWVAELMPVGSVQGQLQIDGFGDMSAFQGKRFWLLTTPAAAIDPQGPWQMGWQEVVLDEFGRFAADRLAFGDALFHQLEPGPDFPYAQYDVDVVDFPALNKHNDPVELILPYSLAKEVVFQIIDEEGNPLPGITVTRTGLNYFDKFSDQTGRVSFWIPGESELQGQLFPYDPFGQFISEPFGVDLDHRRRGDPAEQTLIRLPRSTSIVGRAVDEDHKEVGGATIAYSYSQGSYDSNRETISDRHGRFLLREIPIGATVTISANQQDRASEPITTAPVMHGGLQDVSIQLTRQPTAALLGRVVDHQGDAVREAKITISRVEVRQKEGFGFEDLVSMSLRESDRMVQWTDEQGQFQTPSLVDFAERFQVKIESPGHRPYLSHFLDASRRNVDDGRVMFGEFRLTPHPAVGSVEVHCQSAVDTSPIPHAEIVVIGSRTGGQQVTTDERGRAMIQLGDTPQLVAVRADGFRILFQPIDKLELSLRLSLIPQTAEYYDRRLPWFDRDVKPFSNAARQILEMARESAESGTTFAREMAYRTAQATADFESFRQAVLDPDSTHQYRSNILRGVYPMIYRRAPEQTIDAIRTVESNPEKKAYYLAQLASITDDLELKEELYGEAVYALSQAAGEERLIYAGYVARYLVDDDRLETAQSIVRDAWGSATELRSNWENDGTNIRLAVARIFVPHTIWIDDVLPFRLLGLLASNDWELDRIKSMTLVQLSLVDLERAKAVGKRREIEWTSGLENFLDRFDSIPNLPGYFHQWALEVASTMEQSPVQIQLYLLAASTLPAGTERRRLIQKAVETLETVEVTGWFYWSDPARYALNVVFKFDDLRLGELDELLFASLKNAPLEFSSFHQFDVLANRIRLLSLRDTELAKFLLEPVFQDTAWMHSNYRLRLYLNPLVQTAAWVDADWSLSLMEQWNNTLGVDDPVSTLQLGGEIIEEIERIYLSR